MKVTATTTENYIFNISYFELASMKGAKVPALEIAHNGFTFPVYSTINTTMIQGAKFNEVEIESTRVATSETHFLTLLGLCVNAQSGDIISINQLFERSDFNIDAHDSRFVCNHIPQIYYPSSFGVIVGIDGEYNFDTGLFKGFLQFED